MSENSENIAVCSLCQKALSPDNEITTSDPAINGVCGDCKFLLLEDLGSPQSLRRRLRRRFRYNSSESIENMLNAARQNLSTASAEDDQQVFELLQYGSTHTTPSRSRSWLRVLSDTESDGFYSWSSLYGENESNTSIRRFRVPHGETDSFSFSAYGGDSDVSMDRHSILGSGMFDLPDEGDTFDSDTDIDPMQAGLGQWNLDDMEDDEEEEEDEEDDDEEEEEDNDNEREWDLADEVEAATSLQIFLTSNPRDHRGRITESEVAQIISNLRTFTDGGYPNLRDAGLSPYGANGDYLDARQFEDLLEHLAENDSTRQGAPPASVSFVNNLPCIVIDKEHDKKHGELVCAICKDVLALGTEASQLPCSHLYHTNCILPWLSSRNSCPLCRYELPTDDKDYEEGKQNIDGRHMIIERQQLDEVDDSSSENIDGRHVIIERQQLDEVDDSSSDISNGAEVNEADTTSQSIIQRREVVSSDSTMNSTAVIGGRGRWVFLAAAPIVSLVGIVLVLWLGNSQIEGSRHLSSHNLSVQNQHAVHVYASPDQRESRSRRWWCPF